MIKFFLQNSFFYGIVLANYLHFYWQQLQIVWLMNKEDNVIFLIAVRVFFSVFCRYSHKKRKKKKKQIKFAFELANNNAKRRRIFFRICIVRFRIFACHIGLFLVFNKSASDKVGVFRNFYSSGLSRVINILA